MKKTRRLRPCSHHAPVPTRRLSALAIVLGVALVGAIAGSSWRLHSRATPSQNAGHGSDDLRERAEELIAYSTSVALAPEQERVKAEALASVQAPCGERNSLAVRCCPCNLGKSISGLANHLIARERTGAAGVRQAVLDWIRQTNPSGYSGAACERKRCDQPFHKDGCGGMTDARLVF